MTAPTAHFRVPDVWLAPALPYEARSALREIARHGGSEDWQLAEIAEAATGLLARTTPHLAFLNATPMAHSPGVGWTAIAAVVTDGFERTTALHVREDMVRLRPPGHVQVLVRVLSTDVERSTAAVETFSKTDQYQFQVHLNMLTPVTVGEDGSVSA